MASLCASPMADHLSSTSKPHELAPIACRGHMQGLLLPPHPYSVRVAPLWRVHCHALLYPLGMLPLSLPLPV